MKRHLAVLALILAAPAWSQPPASFDLKSDMVKHIVQATAATQFGTLRPPERTTAEPAPIRKVKFVPPEKPEIVAGPVPGPVAAPPSDKGLIEALIDTLLDVEPDNSAEARYDRWLRCQSGDDLKTTEERVASCALAPGEQTSSVPMDSVPAAPPRR